MAVSVGRRLDMLSLAKENLTVTFPNTHCYIISCTAGGDEQTSRKQPTYYLLVKGVPANLA